MCVPLCGEGEAEDLPLGTVTSMSTSEVCCTGTECVPPMECRDDAFLYTTNNYTLYMTNNYTLYTTNNYTLHSHYNNYTYDQYGIGQP